MRRWTFVPVALLAVFGASACADLDVSNPNDPDASRALATAGDVESLISGSFSSWFSGLYSYNGPGPFMSNQSFQHNAPWANFGMEFYGRIPRNGIQNDVADNYYSYFVRPWYRSYRAIAALADGLRALQDEKIRSELGPEAVERAEVYGKFVQALSHATVALMYDRGFVVTEETDLTQPQEPMDYNALMTEALAMFDDAIQMANAADFTLPQSWMTVALSNDDLVKVMHSYKARFRAQVARTPEERAAVNWTAVVSDIDKGITSDFDLYFDWDNGWYFSALDYSTYYSWSQLAYYMYGMADQSGDYQRWVTTPISQKSYEFAGGEPVLIVTPDKRFSQGATVAEQRADAGTRRFRIITSGEAGSTWKRPDRGTWRWSWYQTVVGYDYWTEEDWTQPEITRAEMNLLKAEARFRANDKAGAAQLINMTRTAAGLNATDANGTNTSCVPKLPNGNCGDLWEMLKWEKRMQTVWTGAAMGNWFFDGRGWGDLFKNTPLQYPVPCQELQVLQILPCNTYGGPGGDFAAPGSTYAWPDEN